MESKYRDMCVLRNDVEMYASHIGWLCSENRAYLIVSRDSLLSPSLRGLIEDTCSIFFNSGSIETRRRFFSDGKDTEQARARFCPHVFLSKSKRKKRLYARPQISIDTRRGSDVLILECSQRESSVDHKDLSEARNVRICVFPRLSAFPQQCIIIRLRVCSPKSGEQEPQELDLWYRWKATLRGNSHTPRGWAEEATKGWEPTGKRENTYFHSFPKVLESSALWSWGYWSASLLLAAWAQTMNAFMGLLTCAALLSPEFLKIKNRINLYTLSFENNRKIKCETRVRSLSRVVVQRTRIQKMSNSRLGVKLNDAPSGKR